MTSTDKTSTDRETERRAELVRGLRELADFIEGHTDFPLSMYPKIGQPIHIADDEAGVAEVERIARLLGVAVDRRDGSGHHRAVRQFGALEYSATYIANATYEQHRDDDEFLNTWRVAGRPALPVVGGPSHPEAPAAPEIADCDSFVIRDGVSVRCAKGRGHDGDHGDFQSIWYEGDEPLDGTEVGGESVEDAAPHLGMSDRVVEAIGDLLLHDAQMRGYEDPAVSR